MGSPVRDPVWGVGLSEQGPGPMTVRASSLSQETTQLFVSQTGQGEGKTPDAGSYFPQA